MDIRSPFRRKERQETPPDGTARADAHHVVVVGAGFAGLSLAQSLGGTPLRVTIVDRRNYHLFQPLLPPEGRSDIHLSSLNGAWRSSRR